jgi:AcrR family transcriptional regulator
MADFRSMAASATTRRRRAARGDGDRLREEILVATAALLARMGSDEALSLRAVAREVGVSAPSVYLHFPDKEALLLAVAAELFGKVERALDAAAVRAGDDPVAAVVARARAYIEWGLENSGQYKVLYEGALWRRLDHPA